MGKAKNLFLLLIALSFFILPASKLILAQEAPSSVFEMDDKSETIILKNGDAKVKETISMSASAFISFRQRYPILSTFTRLFKPMNMPVQIENLEIKVDEAKNQVLIDYLMKGVSVNKGDHWEIDIFPSSPDQKVSLASQNENVLVLSLVGQATQGVRIMTTVTVILPSRAQEIKFNDEAKRIDYSLPSRGLAKNPFLLIGAGVFAALGLLSYFALDRGRVKKILEDGSESKV